MDSKSESHTRFRFRYLWIRIRFRLKSTRFRLQIRFHYTWFRIRNQIRIRIQIRPLIPTPDSESPQVWRMSHTCQHSVIRTETLSFSHRWKPPSRRRKSQSFEDNLQINKMRILLVGSNQRWKLKGIFHSHFGILFLLWCTADMVGDIRGYSENAWLDILVSCARILNLAFTPVSLSDRGDANWRAGRFWDRICIFTKEDADSEEAALIFDNGRTISHDVMRMARYAVQTLHKRRVAALMRCRLPRRTRTEIVSAVMEIYLPDATQQPASERPFSVGNYFGKEHCFELSLDTIQYKKNHLMCRTLVLHNPSCSLNAHNGYFDGITSIVLYIYRSSATLTHVQWC